MSGLAHLAERRGLGRHGVGWCPTTTLSWMGISFLIAFAGAAIVVAVFGAGSRGTELGLKWTARWSFLLFWLAYAGTAMATLFGPRLAGLARRGRDVGLVFALAQLVHVVFVLCLYHIATEPIGDISFLLGRGALRLSPRALLPTATARCPWAAPPANITHDCG